MTSENNLIAKNTVFLYFRMIILMAAKLYLSRVLLDVLGIDNYGVWNVIASFVVSFSFISTPLITATQRFLNFDMGKGSRSLNDIFNTSMELFFAIGLIITIIFETVGVWFIHNKMNFTPDKYTVVLVVYQFAVISFFINMIKMAYEAALIASEKMSFYAISCIIEAFLLLASALLLNYDTRVDKIVDYSAISAIIALILLIVYYIYCKRYVVYTRIKLIWNKALIIEIGKFSWWNLFGGLASMLSNQGLNVLINIFYGVALNATYGISMQIRGAVGVVLENILKAANPQIVHSYAVGNQYRMQSLLFSILKVSYALCLALIIPLILNINFILKLWLGDNIPPLAGQFAILTLVQLLIVSIGNPIDVAIFATGKIKSYQLWLAIILSLNIVVSYILFKSGFSVIWALVAKCFIELIICITRIAFLNLQLKISLSQLFRKVLYPIILLTIIMIIYLFGCIEFISFGEGFHRLILTTSLYLPIFGLVFWFIILTLNQRLMIKTHFLSLIKKLTL